MNTDSQKPSTVKPVSSDPLRQIKWALRDATHPKLTKTTRAVVEALVSRLPNIRPSVPMIAHDAGMSERTAYRALVDLKSIGVIGLYTIAGKGTSYTINLDAIKVLNVAIPKSENRIKASKSKRSPLTSDTPLTSCHPCHHVSGSTDDPCHHVRGTPDIMSPKGSNLKIQSEISDLGESQATSPGHDLGRGRDHQDVQVKAPAECRTVPMYPDVVSPCSRCGRVSHGDGACLVQPSSSKPIAATPSAPVGDQLALLPLSADVAQGSDDAPPTRPSPTVEPKTPARAKRAPKAKVAKIRARVLSEAFALGCEDYSKVPRPVPWMKQDGVALESVADARCRGLDAESEAAWIRAASWRWTRARDVDGDKGQYFPGGAKVDGFAQWIGTETKAAEREAEQIRRSISISSEPFPMAQESSPVMVDKAKVVLPVGYKPTVTLPTTTLAKFEVRGFRRERPVRKNQEETING